MRRVGSVIAKTTILLVLGVLFAQSAAAVSYFGQLTVKRDGVKVAEASGGSVYEVYADYTKLRTKVTFRDVTADGWSSYAAAFQDAWDCTPSGCGWVRMSNDETGKYGKADGWITSYMTEGRVWQLGYRSNPRVCHADPWWNPDNCTGAGWLAP